jgi:predicted methyltransferase MtxX (methanogen marker protein 4)
MWNRPIGGGILIGLDANANIDESIHDAFIIVDMIRDEGMQRMLKGLEDYVEQDQDR